MHLPDAPYGELQWCDLKYITLYVYIFIFFFADMFPMFCILSFLLFVQVKIEEDFVDGIGTILLPFVNRCELLRPNSRDRLIAEFLQHLSKYDLNVFLTVILRTLYYVPMCDSFQSDDEIHLFHFSFLLMSTLRREIYPLAKKLWWI